MVTPLEDWARCKPWLVAAIESAGNAHGIDDVERLISEQRAMFLAGKNAALVAEVLIYPKCRVFRIWLGGGDQAEMEAWLPHLEDLARAHGCTRLRIEGRMGWSRALKSKINRSYAVIERDI